MKHNHLLIERKAGEVIDLILFTKNLRKATAYLSETYVIKATHQFRPMKHDRGNTLLVTCGKPNFLERRYIRLCKKAGVAFPLKQIHLEWYEKRKEVKRRA